MGSTVDAVVVMDADLQHPPSVAPRLVDALTELGADLAVASRYWVVEVQMAWWGWEGSRVRTPAEWRHISASGALGPSPIR